MEAIAEEAGVSLKTVYLPFSTKSGLLRALWDLRLKGDEGDPPVAEHEWFLQVMEERDPMRKLELNACNSDAAKTRIGDLFRVIRGAVEIDADCGELWELIQRYLPRQPASHRRVTAPLRRPPAGSDRRPGDGRPLDPQPSRRLDAARRATGVVAAGIRDLAGTDQLRPVARYTRRVAARGAAGLLRRRW